MDGKNDNNNHHEQKNNNANNNHQNHDLSKVDGKKSRREALPGTGSVLRRTSYFLAGHYPHHDSDDN